MSKSKAQKFAELARESGRAIRHIEREAGRKAKQATRYYSEYSTQTDAQDRISEVLSRA